MHSLSLRNRVTGQLAIVLAAALVVLALSTALRIQSRSAEAAVGTSRGCSFVPDSGPWFNFLAACNSHDSCYIGHWQDKVGCDWKFLNDMRSYCYNTYQWWQWQRGQCLNTAWTYYAGVNVFGWPCYWARMKC